jgi:amidohydrolase
MLLAFAATAQGQLAAGTAPAAQEGAPAAAQKGAPAEQKGAPAAAQKGAPAAAQKGAPAAAQKGAPAAAQRAASPGAREGAPAAAQRAASPAVAAAAAVAAGAEGGPGVLERSAAFARGEYEWFHAHPELSNQERETAARMATALESMGAKVWRGVGGTGVVALLEGEKAGPRVTVLYRADMDGLPVEEQTQLPYRSQTPGVMHACGHDLHMATALGALRTLAETRSDWSGSVLFVAQPAEEISGGAKQMLADPGFRQILARTGKPRVAFAVHDAADIPAGQVAVSAGYTTANVDSVDITLHGRDGHGAKPQLTVDPIVMAAELVLQLQTIVSRRIPPEADAVVTIGKIAAGTTHNIIPSSADLLLTVRSYDDETRRTLLAEIEHITRSVAASYHAPTPPKVSVRKDFTPAGLNDEAWSARIRARFEALLGKERVVPIPPSMGGDDFARFGRELSIPTVYWRLGAVPAPAYAQRDRKPLPSLHSATWAPDVRVALPVGIQTTVAAIREGLSAP